MPSLSHGYLTDQRLLTWGAYATFAFGLVVILALAATGKETLLLVAPVALLAPVGVYLAVRYPVVNLAILFGLFMLASRNEAGLGTSELLFGLYYLPYLGLWYGSRLFVYRERIVVQKGDLAVLFFLAWALISLPLGLLGGGRAEVGLSELANFSLLALYFPFRELCVRYRHGVIWLLGFLVAAGALATINNIIAFSGVIAQSPDLRGIARGRIASNEVLIFFSTVAGLTGALYARIVWTKFAFSVGFALCIIGTIITQYRAFYVGVAIAVLVTFLFSDASQRKLIFIALGTSLACAIAISYLIIGDLVNVFFAGIVDRITSIGSAHERDISVINRFIEYQYVKDLIIINPIIGYGLGSEYGFYDAIYHNTRTKPYVHNAYLHLWYKLGLVGIVLLMYPVVVAVRRGIRMVTGGLASCLARAKASFVVGSLAGLAAAALASVLYNSDTMLPLAICLAVGAAMADRSGYLQSPH